MEIAQTIIIIILIIIAIIAIIFLVARVEFPPPTFFTPFANGSVIRIKSLANDRYLRVAGPQDYPGCVNPQYNGNQVLQIVADTADPTQAAQFTLCQYVGGVGAPEPPGNNAVYTLFVGNQNNEEVVTFARNAATFGATVNVTTNAAPGCPQFNSDYPNGPFGNVDRAPVPYFSFSLQEVGTTDTNGLQSSAYIIRDGTNGTSVLTSTGAKFLQLYQTCTTPSPSINPTNCTVANSCPVIPLMQLTDVIGAISVLYYTFEIEVISSPSQSVL